MGKYKVYHSQKFDEELSKFDKDFYNRVDKIEDQLVENPYVGDPISVKWFREKRYGKYRIYYLIYEDIQAVFMVGISEKKDQQKIINTIKFLFIASNLQSSIHFPHFKQRSLSITAVLPLINTWRCFMSGSSKRCKSAASTSQSAITLFFAIAAKDAVTIVLPVPPFPLITTICFILILSFILFCLQHPVPPTQSHIL